MAYRITLAAILMVLQVYGTMGGRVYGLGKNRIFPPIGPVKPPHIVFLLADDLGWNDIGYHNDEVKTPTLDRLAAEGVKLENYYAQSFCSPSRGQLLTGRYAATTGLSNVILGGIPEAMPLSETLISQKLKERGYSSHIVGKWHVGCYERAYLPTNRGFDSFYGIQYGRGDFYTHEFCGVVSGVCGLDIWNNTRPDPTKNGTYSTDIYVERATDIINKHDPTDPLFLYMAFQLPHEPLQVPAKFEALYDDMPNGKRKTFLAMVSALDAAVANIHQALEDNGMLDNTVIVFSSDNGGSPLVGGNNGPLKGIKGSLWEGGIKVPAFVWSKLLRRPRRKVTQLASITDWYPTFLGLAGLDASELKLDGFDIWKLISTGGHGGQQRKELLHELIWPSTSSRLVPRGSPLYNGTFDTSQRAALRWGKWKLITGQAAAIRGYEDGAPLFFSILGPDPTIEDVPLDKNVWLYDMKRDPLEECDLSDTKPKIVKRMLDRLEEIRQMSPPTIFVSERDPALNPALHGGVWAPRD
ncbi:arylsulfatase J [Lingula anatina]|uniref:Arylsulfatase J n=1 Tax=Lingula anatina TaxID=7574 RepID=A0A1S3JQ15_LINAN|nr:arylsulfatase J [Lingula anatina]|eukprot:XP_013412440.1 arylsulfatase J [Lingula anatina]